MLEAIDPMLAPDCGVGTGTGTGTGTGNSFRRDDFVVRSDDVAFFRPGHLRKAVPGTPGSGPFKSDRPGSRDSTAPRLRFATENKSQMVVAESNPFSFRPSRVQAHLTRPESKASAMRLLRERKRRGYEAAEGSLNALLSLEAELEAEAER